MTVSRIVSTCAVLLALPLVVGACSAPPPAAAPTVAPAATTVQPTATSRPAAAVTPAAFTSPTSAVTLPIGPTAVATAASGPTASELASKAKANVEYSYDFKMTAAGQTITGKSFVKGTKMRQEISVAGMNTVMLLDLANKVAYSLLTEQKTAMKMDFSQVAAQSEQPGTRAGSLNSDAKLVGKETIDGKPAAIYEVASSNAKYWLWTENGMPLKVEATTAEGKIVTEYTNYKFGSQPDNLFELPPDTEVVDIPTGLPGGLSIPGQVPSR